MGATDSTWLLCSLHHHQRRRQLRKQSVGPVLAKMTGGENQAQREPGLAFRPQPATSPAPPPPAPVRRASGVTTTDDFVIDHLHKLELAGGPGVATRLADSAHLQVIRPPPPFNSFHLPPPPQPSVQLSDQNSSQSLIYLENSSSEVTNHSLSFPASSAPSSSSQSSQYHNIILDMI